MRNFQTVTTKGQFTLNKTLLHHLGIKGGDRVQIDRLPNNEIRITSKRNEKDVSELFGLLADETSHKATLEEINDAIANGWAGL